jgi:glycosyltransferase involved in cell wall biosynthesis
MQPQISVVMPVYNAEQYLALAIESVLGQTLTDFELLLINDGSADGSLTVMRSFDDRRIRILNNDDNKGLVYSLNRGLAEARGKYIARMDADDICLPDRFQLQAAFLDEHPETGLVAGFISLTDEEGRDKGAWPLDRKANNAFLIRRYMSSECCIAHPAVMGRTGLLQQYRYMANQKAIEDYDLWLRLLTDGVIIDKLKIPVLLYRVHSKSVTQKDNRKNNVFFKIARCKRRFIAGCIKKKRINFFVLTVLVKMILNYIMGMAKSIKQRLQFDV